MSVSAPAQMNIEELFTALAGVMQEVNLARISIPLDLVAIAWSRRG